MRKGKTGSFYGYYTSLALDAPDRPHISYCYRPFYMENRSRLKYAHHDGFVWHFETVDKEGSVGGYTSLALGAAGQPHIGYYDWGNRNLKYAHHDGDTWLVEAIDIAKTRDSDTSMALDAQDRPYLAYSNSRYGTLLIASYNGTTWVTETVDSGESSSYDPSLVVDGNDQPHVSYLQYPRGPGPSPGRLVYAYRAGTGWVTETVVSDEIGGPSLALDQAGRPHIGYSVYSDVKYAYFDGISWNIEVVDGGEGEKGDPSIALDSHGRPHFSYCLISGYSCVSLEYAYHDGSTWRIETVDSGEGVGSYSSLALDTADLPHVTFADGIDGDLRYARHDGSGWRVETIDTADWVGSYSSLALDASGQPHVSYNSGLTSDLRYAYAVCVPPERVEVRGPLALLVDQERMYWANVQPVTASLPLVISWDNGTFGPEAIYSWTLTGTYSLTVTAANAYGEAQGTLEVEVLQEWPYHFYLPVLPRGGWP